jgi:hypothetical protein
VIETPTWFSFCWCLCNCLSHVCKNKVASYFPRAAQVVGFLDSPYYLDIVPYTSSFPGFAYEESNKYLHMNTTGVIPADCAAAFPGPYFSVDSKVKYSLSFLSYCYYYCYYYYSIMNIIKNKNEHYFKGNSWKCQLGQYRMPFVSVVECLFMWCLK